MLLQITYHDKAIQTETEGEDTIEKILKAITTLCTKVDSMDNEIQKLKTNEDNLKSKASQQHDYKNAELRRSEDGKKPELKGDDGKLLKTHNVCLNTATDSRAQLAPNARTQARADPAEPFATSAWQPQTVKKKSSRSEASLVSNSFGESREAIGSEQPPPPLFPSPFPFSTNELGSAAPLSHSRPPSSTGVATTGRATIPTGAPPRSTAITAGHSSSA
ncbi:hypothetical protein MTR67_002460 [Solanum verrucosum]|uniref:Uncharacterized protein n=1 Tax=Solanum verrucosum TaxID=315347 RepID=A0AAF0PTP8_SOLVR|nr:hypothetical protein MTR67_002460 [Solanum verrucosum]